MNLILKKSSYVINSSNILQQLNMTRLFNLYFIYYTINLNLIQFFRFEFLNLEIDFMIDFLLKNEKTK